MLLKRLKVPKHEEERVHIGHWNHGATLFTARERLVHKEQLNVHNAILRLHNLLQMALRLIESL